MQINSNYAMPSYNNRNCKKPSFQAKLSEDLAQKLQTEAECANVTDLLANQINQLKDWGDRDSVITESFDLDKGTSSLSLFNEKLSTLYGGNLNVNEGLQLLGQFLGLNKKDVLTAEREIVNNVDKNKEEAVLKILGSPKYIEKLTGEENPTLRELDKAIDSLSEVELMEYRFGLQDRVNDFDNLVPFDIVI